MICRAFVALNEVRFGQYCPKNERSDLDTRVEFPRGTRSWSCCALQLFTRFAVLCSWVSAGGIVSTWSWSITLFQVLTLDSGAPFECQKYQTSHNFSLWPGCRVERCFISFLLCVSSAEVSSWIWLKRQQDWKWTTDSSAFILTDKSC